MSSTRLILSNVAIVLTLFLCPTSTMKKKCGVKVVAIEQIKYKAVPVEVVDEKAYSSPPSPPAPSYGGGSPPASSYGGGGPPSGGYGGGAPPSSGYGGGSSKYSESREPDVSLQEPETTELKAKKTTKTPDLTEIFEEMMDDYRRTSTKRPSRPTTVEPAPSPAPSPAPAPQVYIMPIPVPMATTTPPPPIQYTHPRVPPMYPRDITDIMFGRRRPSLTPTLRRVRPAPQPAHLTPLMPMNVDVSYNKETSTSTTTTSTTSSTTKRPRKNEDKDEDENEYEDEEEAIRKPVRLTTKKGRKLMKKRKPKPTKVDFDDEPDDDEEEPEMEQHYGAKFPGNGLTQQDEKAIRQLQKMIGKNGYVAGLMNTIGSHPATFADYLKNKQLAHRMGLMDESDGDSTEEGEEEITEQPDADDQETTEPSEYNEEDMGDSQDDDMDTDESPDDHPSESSTESNDDEVDEDEETDSGTENMS